MSRVDLKDASIAELAAEAKERGWRLIPTWVFALLSAGINTGYWSMTEKESEE